MQWKQIVQTLLFFVLSGHLFAQSNTNIPASLTIPDKVSTSIGTLEFKDGAPSAATTQKLYDNLDFLHAQNVFLNTFQYFDQSHKNIL